MNPNLSQLTPTACQRCDILARQTALLLGVCKLLLDRLEREGTGARETWQAIDLARDAIRAIEPLDAEPLDAEPLDAEPLDAEPADAEPLDAEPADAEPADAEPADAEPADAEPADVVPLLPPVRLPLNASKSYRRGGLIPCPANP